MMKTPLAIILGYILVVLYGLQTTIYEYVPGKKYLFFKFHCIDTLEMYTNECICAIHLFMKYLFNVTTYELIICNFGLCLVSLIYFRMNIIQNNFVTNGIANSLHVCFIVNTLRYFLTRKLLNDTCYTYIVSQNLQVLRYVLSNTLAHKDKKNIVCCI